MKGSAMALVYVFHIAFYALFAIRKLSPGTVAAPAAPPSAAPDSGAPSAPHARGLIVAHGLANSVLYFGLGRAVLSQRGSPFLFPAQPILGGAVMVAAGALLVATLRVFQSWRLLARIEEGHQLCTRGPFRFIRHPIYASMDLLALGTFLWAPSLVVLVGAALIALSGDLRGRTEERLLTEVFGDEYRDYCRRTARTIPGLY
jgi:protein-S-isoprenylcysteine O-methyltransferase Ste14